MSNSSFPDSHSDHCLIHSSPPPNTYSIASVSLITTTTYTTPTSHPPALIIMTTNSFGGALPPFDFPPQPAPAVSRMARVSKALPVVLFTTAIAGTAFHLKSPTRPGLHANILF